MACNAGPMEVAMKENGQKTRHREGELSSIKTGISMTVSGSAIRQMDTGHTHI
jgi:hypothetical protein